MIGADRSSKHNHGVRHAHGREERKGRFFTVEEEEEDDDNNALATEQ